MWRPQFEFKCATNSINVCLFSYLGTHVVSMYGGHSLRLYVPQKVSMCVCFPKCGTHVVSMCGDHSLRLYVPQKWFTMCGFMFSICSNYILKEYVGAENIKRCPTFCPKFFSFFSEVPFQKHIVSMFDN